MAAERSVFTDCDDIPNPPPSGYAPNAGRASVGYGPRCYRRAVEHLRHWRQAPGRWCEFVHEGPAAAGQKVAVVARVWGLWVVNVCEVTSVRPFESADWSSFSITYATLAGHDMTGAEQFRVTWDHTTDCVTYDVASYSRPQSVLAWLGLPLVRHLQRRFVGESTTRLSDDVLAEEAACRPRGISVAP